MKTVVESVRIRTSDGVEKSIKIRDEKYNMKYNFLIKLAEDGVLVWDGAAQRAFLEIAKKYVKIPKSKR